ncbi:unnamed protein product [Cylicocyclus nassatus]|uniref:Uncharacterized protein n=1 Tax=Cylicocyclus nassatus TaxID=53992 RepID=A0AA36DUR6_CYLNA|nr:unnamed protein product [Cylicocyclus nassatus]
MSTPDLDRQTFECNLKSSRRFGNTSISAVSPIDFIVVFLCNSDYLNSNNRVLRRTMFAWQFFVAVVLALVLDVLTLPSFGFPGGGNQFGHHSTIQCFRACRTLSNNSVKNR